MSSTGGGRRRGVLAAAAAFLVVLAALALVPSAPAKPLSERIAETRQKLAKVEHREGVLTTTISRYSSKIGSLQGEVATLRNREARVRRQLAVQQSRLERARQRLERERQRLVDLRKKLRRSTRVLEERLVSIYKSSDPDVLTVVLQADGFADLLERAEYMRRIGDEDARLVGRVRDLRDESKVTVKRLTTIEEGIEAARDSIASKRRELERTRSSLQKRTGQLVGARAGKRRALGSVRQHKHKYEGDLRGLEAQEARIRASLVGGGPGAMLPAGPVRRGSGGLVWPVNGPMVSPFGQRWGRLHAGIDIAAPSGTPIRAAKAGKVVMASPMSGYGNYVCVNHGGGLSTCYAHLSSYATSAGASLSQGQVLGSVGCTGHCYGDHLHFEVRVGGSPTDPMAYL